MMQLMKKWVGRGGRERKHKRWMETRDEIAIFHFWFASFCVSQRASTTLLVNSSPLSFYARRVNCVGFANLNISSCVGVSFSLVSPTTNHWTKQFFGNNLHFPQRRFMWACINRESRNDYNCNGLLWISRLLLRFLGGDESKICARED